jgi:hypothetical protein
MSAFYRDHDADARGQSRARVTDLTPALSNFTEAWASQQSL